MQKNKVNMFENVVERLARLLTSQWGIKVVFRHGKCETNGKIITLPTIPPGASKELLNAMHGHLDHEAAHVVFTKFNEVTVDKKTQPKLFSAFNALEDLRINHKWVGVYPGSRVNFRNTRDWLLGKFVEERDIVDPDTGAHTAATPWSQLSNFGKFLVAATVYASNDFNVSNEFLQKTVDPKILEDVQKLSHIFKDVLTCESTADVIPLAKKLLEELNELEDPPPPQEPEKGKGEEDENEAEEEDSGGAAGSDSDGEEESEGKPGEGEQGADSEEEEEGGEEEDGEEGEGDSEDRDTDGGEESEEDESDAEVESFYDTDGTENSANDSPDAASFILEDVAEGFEPGGYAVYTTEGDVMEPIPKLPRREYQTFLRSVNAMVGTMKNKMARNLLSTTQSRWEGEKTRGKIDPKRLHQIATGGSNRVFRQRLEAPNFDTAVLLMVDHSGSMNGTKLNLAAQTAVVFGEILNQLNIPFSVVGFSTVDSGYVGAARRHRADESALKTFTRWGDLWLGEYKSFEEPWQFAAPAVLSMKQQSRHNTLDGETVTIGTKILLNRPEKRKVLFWLNDGEPCPNQCDNGHAAIQHTTDCAAESQKHVELFAIGIGTEAVKRYYKNWVCVRQLSDLPSVCLGKLDALLQKGRPRW